MDAKDTAGEGWPQAVDAGTEPRVGQSADGTARVDPGSTTWRTAPSGAPTANVVPALALDAIAGMAAVYLATAAMHVLLPDPPALASRTLAVATALFPVLACLALGLYRAPGGGPVERLRLRAIGSGLFGAAGVLIMAETFGWLAATGWGILAGGLAFGIGAAGHAFVASLAIRSNTYGTPAVVIGTDEAARAVAAGLVAHPETGFRPVGFVALSERGAVGVGLPLPILCRLEHAAAISSDIRVAVIAAPLQDRATLESRLGPLPFPHLALIEDLQAVHRLRLQAWTEVVEPSDVRPPVRRDFSLALDRTAKRAIDLLIAVPAGLLALPLIAGAIVAVRLADPGKALFLQRRIGFRGEPFDIFKIRTMYQDAQERLDRCLREDPALAQEWRRHFKLAKDPRILPGVGHVLRRFSLDELPQIWNVIKGDMSLVGPRPFPSYHLDEFDPEFRATRASVMPGLTGLWQIGVRSDADLEQQKAQDLLYIRNRSIWLDLQILIDTLPAVIRAKGAI